MLWRPCLPTLKEPTPTKPTPSYKLRRPRTRPCGSARCVRSLLTPGLGPSGNPHPSEHEGQAKTQKARTARRCSGTPCVVFSSHVVLWEPGYTNRYAIFGAPARVTQEGGGMKQSISNFEVPKAIITTKVDNEKCRDLVCGAGTFRRMAVEMLKVPHSPRE